jgi:hypothetical protein
VACFQNCIFFFKAVEDVTHAQADTCGFVAVCGADALAGGAHFGLTFGGFVGTVQDTVGRQDQVGALADVQTSFQVVSCGLQFLGFGHEQVRSDDATVADDVHFVFCEDARRDGAEHELLAFENDGVSGIRAACETGHHVIFRGKHVYHFSFAFVSENDA